MTSEIAPVPVWFKITGRIMPPMKPAVVTFDCANTLVRVRWTPGGFALDCARAAGLELGPGDREAYERLLRSRWTDYREINAQRDPSLGDAFWERLTGDWLREIGQAPTLAPKLIAAAPELLYGAASDQFTLFDDVLPTLDALEARGIRMAVISNWDYSLHRVLRALAIHDRFACVVASLEEGVEKPDARLFHLTLEQLGVAPEDAVHVGDDPLDDFRGAQDAGMTAYLLDRAHAESRGAVLARLIDLVEKIV